MSEIVWQDPPEPIKPHGRGAVRQWEPRLAPLREHPKRWGLIRQYPSASTARQKVFQLRHGRIAGVDPADWEFTQRLNADGSGDLYARFVGEA